MIDSMIGSVKDLFSSKPDTSISEKPKQTVDIADVDDMYKSCRDARMPMERHWMENLAFYMGEQWLLWSEETKKGLSVNLVFGEKKLEKESLLKSYMDKFAQPKWVN